MKNAEFYLLAMQSSAARPQPLLQNRCKPVPEYLALSAVGAPFDSFYAVRWHIRHYGKKSPCGNLNVIREWRGSGPTGLTSGSIPHGLVEELNAVQSTQAEAPSQGWCFRGAARMTVRLVLRKVTYGWSPYRPRIGLGRNYHDNIW